MKSFVKFGMFSLALSVASCGMPDQWDNTPYTPDSIIEPSGPKVVEFTANAPTKTAVNEADNTVTWVAGDKVKFIWEGGSTVASATASGSTTKFKVEIAEGVEEMYAVYPSTMTATLTDGQLTLEFGNDLEALSFSGADVCVSKAVKKEGSWNVGLDFKRVASLVKIGVTAESVTSVRVSAAEGIAGKLPVVISEDGNIVCGTPTETNSAVNMTIPAPGVYYVPILPDVVLADGMNVTFFEGADASEPLVSESGVVARGDMIAFAQPETFTGKFYVSPMGGGTKTGYSVLNPMDIAAFRSFVADAKNNSDIDGNVFVFAAGKYPFDDYVTLDFANNDGITFSIEGADPSAGVTEFVGSTGEKAGALWLKANADITVKNVTFSGTDGVSGCAAVRLEDASSKLALESCSFNDNKTSGNGAAIVLTAGTMNISNCIFLGNIAASGSALYVNGESASVSIADSKFEANVADGEYDEMCAGAVLLIGDAGGSVSFTDTKFYDNGCLLGSNILNAGIIRVLADGQSLFFDNCVFDGNYSNRSMQSNNACASVLQSRSESSFYFNACEFRNNTSGTGHGSGVYGGYGGMVITIFNAADIAWNNCYIHDNYGGRDNQDLRWIVNYDESLNFVMANTTVIGDVTRYGETEPLSTRPVIWFFENAEYSLLNNIMCSKQSDGFALGSEKGVDINSFYNKTSPELDADIHWGTDTGSGHDYYANSSSFGALNGFMWNGTLTGERSDKLAPTAEVNEKIREASPDFYDWLQSIRALGVDILGTSRGTTSWPGCYQK